MLFAETNRILMRLQTSLDGILGDVASVVLKLGLGPDDVVIRLFLP